MAHAGLDGLGAEEKAGLGLLPDAVQLLLGGAVVGQLLDQTADGLQGLALLVPVQGGVDAQSLDAIQEFSAKEFRALSSGNVGEGVMVWNKKVVMFDALISKNNTLYRSYNTNFHEKAKEQKKLSFEEVVPNFGTKEEPITKYVLKEKEEQLILKVACIMETDVERILKKDRETSLGYLKLLEEEGKLKEVNGRYRKVG